MGGSLELSDYRFLLVPISIGMLVSALVIPWISINFLGYRSYSPIDILPSLLQPQDDKTVGKQEVAGLSTIMMGYSHAFSLSSMILFVLAIGCMLSSIMLKDRRRDLSLLAGIFAIFAGTFWIYAVEASKMNFSQAAQLTGGAIAGEFVGKEDALVNSLFIIGFGHYVVIAAGAIAILYYFLERRARPRQVSTDSR